MRKTVKAILVLALGIVVVIALSTVTFSQGKSKNPPKDTTTWGIKIAPTINLTGMDEGAHIYTDDDPNVRISVYESTTGQTVDYTSIKFWIYVNALNDLLGNPLETWARFSLIPYDIVIADDTGPLGIDGFPPLVNGEASGSLYDFLLNSDHPKEGYEHVMFSFRIYDDLEDTSVFPIGGRPDGNNKYTGSGAITIYIWNSFEALTPEDPFPFQTVRIHLASLCNDDPENPDRGYHITRTEPEKWEFRLQDQILDIRQSYTWEEVTGIGKNKKPIITRTSYVPQTGLAWLSYKIFLIRNPS